MISDAAEEKAFCPKCRQPLFYVTALPHPKAPQMRKTTFVCYPCNRTWTYSLAAEVAERYAAGSHPDVDTAGP